jgi:iron complex outermembrane recepter protein
VANIHFLRTRRVRARLAALAAWSAWAPCWGQVTGADPGEGPLSRIVIEAQRPTPEYRRASINELTTAPLSETPISASVIGADQLLDRGVNSLSSALRDEPSAADNYNTFGYVERIKVRGFDLDEKLNFRRDGLPVTNHVPIGLENKQAIEILKGVAGVLGGDAAPGGVLNYVLKRPTDTPLRQLSAEYSERGSRLLTGDLGGRLANDRFGYRINLAAEDRHPAADNAWSRRAFGSGFFDWRVAPGTLLELEFEHQGIQEISVPGFGLLDTTGSHHLAAADRSAHQPERAAMDPTVPEPRDDRLTASDAATGGRLGTGRAPGRAAQRDQ